MGDKNISYDFQQHAIISENDGMRRTEVSGVNRREIMVYLSQSNRIQIELIDRSNSNFLLKYTGNDLYEPRSLLNFRSAC